MRQMRMTRVNNASNSDQSQQQLPEPLEKKKSSAQICQEQAVNYLIFSFFTVRGGRTNISQKECQSS